MIRAHMATYPARRDLLEQSVRSLAPQVDRVFLILNDYAEVPPELADIPNLKAILPAKDLKDTGKFLPVPAADDVVVLADDDLLYNPDHVRHLLAAGEEIGLDRNVVGLHGALYLSPLKRRTLRFFHALDAARRVHQLGTGTVLALGRNLPPHDFMAGSEKFVDVRYARWLAEQGIGLWIVARPRGFLVEIPDDSGRRETIFQGFTKLRPQALQDEVRALIAALPADLRGGLTVELAGEEAE